MVAHSRADVLFIGALGAIVLLTAFATAVSRGESAAVLLLVGFALLFFAYAWTRWARRRWDATPWIGLWPTSTRVSVLLWTTFYLGLASVLAVLVPNYETPLGYGLVAGATLHLTGACAFLGALARDWNALPWMRGGFLRWWTCEIRGEHEHEVHPVLANLSFTSIDETCVHCGAQYRVAKEDYAGEQPRREGDA